MLKAYKYRIYPTSEQRLYLAKTFGCTRFCLLYTSEINRNTAEKICNEKKSIEKSLKEVEKVARKKAVAGCAVLSDNEVFKIVREYYQFEAVQDKFIQVEVEEIKEQIQEDVNEERVKEKKEDSKTDDFSINFDDYL